MVFYRIHFTVYWIGGEKPHILNIVIVIILLVSGKYMERKLTKNYISY